jgi:hypothetical protein
MHVANRGRGRLKVAAGRQRGSDAEGGRPQLDRGRWTDAKAVSAAEIVLDVHDVLLPLRHDADSWNAVRQQVECDSIVHASGHKAGGAQRASQFLRRISIHV